MDEALLPAVQGRPDAPCNSSPCVEPRELPAPDGATPGNHVLTNEQNTKDRGAPDVGQGAAVKIGCKPRLERFEAHLSGKSPAQNNKPGANGHWPRKHFLNINQPIMHLTKSLGETNHFAMILLGSMVASHLYAAEEPFN